MTVDDALRFLLEIAEAEYLTRRAMLIEPDDKAFQQLAWKWDAMYTGDIRSGLSRPDMPTSVYARDENIEVAKHLHRRSIFAVLRHQHDEGELYRACMGDTESGEYGEGMCQGFYLKEEGGALKIVTRLYICIRCYGAGMRRDQAGCGMCEGTGWLHDGGMEWPDLEDAIEIRKLQAPSDERYRQGYEAIGTLPTNFPPF
jgi:hypothetical protein